MPLPAKKKGSFVTVLKFEPKITVVPKLGWQTLEFPQLLGIETRLKMNRVTAETLFKRAKFDDSDFDKDGYCVISEIMRPVKEGETVVVEHKLTGVKMCVDHYECGGVIL